MPASVREGGKMKKKKNKKVETLRVPLHTYIHVHMREATQVYASTHTHTYIYLPAHVSNVGQGVFLGPPEPPKIYSQIPQDKW